MINNESADLIYEELNAIFVYTIKIISYIFLTCTVYCLNNLFMGGIFDKGS